MTPIRHSLSERDTTARSATCSVCGPVRIQRAGTGWVCAIKQKEHGRAWRARNPQRNHGRGHNPHQLTARSALLRSATCSTCGPVEIQPWARGWICSTRAHELGRVVPQDAPQEHCRDCKAADGVLVWLTAGACSRCAEIDLGMEFAKLAADDRLVADMVDWAADGLHVASLGDPYAMPDYESAVPGWKTLG